MQTTGFITHRQGLRRLSHPHFGYWTENTQLNKGESLHSLREFLFFAHRGKIQRKQEEEQVHQSTCLNLLTNAVIAWNTVYMAAAIDRHRIDGHSVQETDLGHPSPCRYEHINPYGK